MPSAVAGLRHLAGARAARVPHRPDKTVPAGHRWGSRVSGPAGWAGCGGLVSRGRAAQTRRVTAGTSGMGRGGISRGHAGTDTWSRAARIAGIWDGWAARGRWAARVRQLCGGAGVAGAQTARGGQARRTLAGLAPPPPGPLALGI